MRAFAIGCAAVMLLAGGVGCKKKPAEKKDKAAGEMKAGAMTTDDMSPEKRPVATPEKRPVVDTPEPKPPVDKEAVAEGVLSGVKGGVEVRRAGTAEFKAAKDDDKVFAKDSVRVGKDGEATLALWDNSSVELTPESAITLNTSAAIKNPSPSVTVMAGAARFDIAERTEGQGTFSIYTPAAAVAVQGTVLAVGVGLTGNARVAVEEGKVEVVPVAKIEVKPMALAAGKVILVPYGKPAAAPKAYSVEKAGWDEWLEAEGQAAAKNADAVAALHSGNVDTLNADAATLENAEDKGSQEGENLEKQVNEAEKTNKPAVYKTVQPKLASHLERQAAIRANLRLTHGRRYAHAYLLGLLAGRIQGGVYKTKAATQAAVLKHYQRVASRRAKWRMRRYKRRMKQRRRLRRMRRAYYLHHADGRKLAGKIKFKVPKFYAKLKLRRKLRRQRLVIEGWKRPLYRRPMYRGKRRKMSPREIAARAQRRRLKTWFKHKKYQERRRKRAMRNKAKRALWRKHIIMKRRARWAKRPAYRKAWRVKVRKWRRGMRRGMRHGMGPHGMMRGPHGMMRGPHGMMRGPHGMMRGMHGMRGMRGMHGMKLTPMQRRKLKRKIRKMRRKMRKGM